MFYVHFFLSGAPLSLIYQFAADEERMEALESWRKLWRKSFEKESGFPGAGSEFDVLLCGGSWNHRLDVNSWEQDGE